MTVNQPQYRHHDRSDAMALDELTLDLFDRMPQTMWVQPDYTINEQGEWSDGR